MVDVRVRGCRRAGFWQEEFCNRTPEYVWVPTAWYSGASSNQNDSSVSSILDVESSGRLSAGKKRWHTYSFRALWLLKVYIYQINFPLCE